MEVFYSDSTKLLGNAAAQHAKRIIDRAIEKRGTARIVLSTGASQFAFFEAFVACDIDWPRVEVFHLDEYIGISEEHKASFCKYLVQRFSALLPKKLKRLHLISGQGDPHETIKRIGAELMRAPVDLGMIGIGENAHIAFNDPPADFETEEPYIIVNLDKKCKAQQVGEGWFRSEDEVYDQAITMGCRQIMRCGHIISFVPYASKAAAVESVLNADTVTPAVPATLLKTHKDFSLYLDKDSAKKILRSKSFPMVEV